MPKRNTQIALIIIALLSLIAVLAFPDSDLMRKLNQNSNVLLFFLTAVYVTLTYLILESSRKTSAEQMRPFVYASLVLEGMEILLSVKNMGNRPACNVRLNFDPSLDLLSPGPQFQGAAEPLLNQSFMPPDFEVRNFITSTMHVVSAESKNKRFKVRYSTQIHMEILLPIRTTLILVRMYLTKCFFNLV